MGRSYNRVMSAMQKNASVGSSISDALFRAKNFLRNKPEALHNQLAYIRHGLDAQRAAGPNASAWLDPSRTPFAMRNPRTAIGLAAGVPAAVGTGAYLGLRGDEEEKMASYASGNFRNVPQTVYDPSQQPAAVLGKLERAMMYLKTKGQAGLGYAKAHPYRAGGAVLGTAAAAGGAYLGLRGDEEEKAASVGGAVRGAKAVGRQIAREAGRAGASVSGAAGAVGDTARRAGGAVGDAAGRVRDTGGEAGRRARDAALRVPVRVGDAVTGTGARISDLLGSVAGEIKAQKQGLGRGYQRLAGDIRYADDPSTGLFSRAGQLIRRGVHKVRHRPSTQATFAERNPLATTGLLAGGAGAAGTGAYLGLRGEKAAAAPLAALGAPAAYGAAAKAAPAVAGMAPRVAGAMTGVAAPAIGSAARNRRVQDAALNTGRALGQATPGTRAIAGASRRIGDWWYGNQTPTPAPQIRW